MLVVTHTLSTWEAEIGRVTVGSQPRQTDCGTSSQKKTQNGLEV
jgi:hypothetical protein